MSSNRLTSIRLSEYTDAQLQQLTDMFGISNAELIARAIDELWQRRLGPGNPLEQTEQSPSPKQQPKPQT